VIHETLGPIDRIQLQYSDHYDIKVPAGIYTASQLIGAINDQSPKIIPYGSPADYYAVRESVDGVVPESAFKMYFTESERKTRIKFNSFGVALHFPTNSKHLRGMLGFENQSLLSTEAPIFKTHVQTLLDSQDRNKNEFDNDIDRGITHGALSFLVQHANMGMHLKAIPSIELVSKRCINIFFGNQSLFLYTDLVDFCVIGDTVQQLLRAVPIKAGSAFELVTERFERPHYVPV
jgi:hypothetical protein